MKRLFAIISVILMLALLPVYALAAEQPISVTTAPPMALSATPSPTDIPTTTPPEGDIMGDATAYFSIDNNNVYKDMNKAYKDGYMPTIQNNRAIIILPLIPNGEISQNTIKATPNLGDPATSPFVFKNYQKTVLLQNNEINNTKETVSSYYVRFELELSATRLNGTYPIVLEIEAEDKNRNKITQAFTSYITITDGSDPNAQPDTEPTVPADTEKKPTSQPIVIVSNNTVTPSPITAGEEFEVDITLLNTNESKAVQNMTVTVTSESPSLTLLNDSNVFYFKKLGKADTLSLKLKYKAGLETVPGKYNINLALSYDNSEATTLTSAGLISVEITQPMRVELTMPTVAESVNAGDTLPLSFQVMNLGRSAVYNARCEISGAGLLPSGTAFVGNMEPGTAANADVNVFIGTKDMSDGYSGTEKYGATTGTVKLLYEDANGKEYSEEFTFNTTINEPVINASGDTEEAKPETAGQWWITIVVLGVVAAGVAVWFIIRKKKGQK